MDLLIHSGLRYNWKHEMFEGLATSCRTKTNKLKSTWNDTSETFRDVILTLFAMVLASGKFLKDIGSKMFFMTSLFGPLLGATALGVGFNDFIALIFALGISYTNYLTSYSSLKYKIVKQFKELEVEESDESAEALDEDVEESTDLLLNIATPTVHRPEFDEETFELADQSLIIEPSRQPVITAPLPVTQRLSYLEQFKNKLYAATLHGIALTRMFFVVSDTYLGISKLYNDIAELFGTNIKTKLLNQLTNSTGTYFSFSDGIMYCAYAYRLLLSNGQRLRWTLTLENIKKSSKWKLGFSSLFAALGILTKGIKDCFTISVSLSYVPFIKQLPSKALTGLGYLGGVSSVLAKSIFEGLELGHLLYRPTPFIRETRELTEESKLVYLQLFAFLLNSTAEAASGYQALEWVFEKTGLSEELEDSGYLETVQIPCAIAVALSVAALEFAFNVRSLSENAAHQRELESGDSSSFSELSLTSSDDVAGTYDESEPHHSPGLHFAYRRASQAEVHEVDSAYRASSEEALTSDDETVVVIPMGAQTF